VFPIVATFCATDSSSVATRRLALSERGLLVADSIFAAFV